MQITCQNSQTNSTINLLAIKGWERKLTATYTYNRIIGVFMQYTVKSGDITKEKSACTVVAIYSECKLSATAAALDEASGGGITQILGKGDLRGESGQSLMLYDLTNLSCERVLLVGCGKEGELDAKSYKKAVALATETLNRSHITEAIYALPELNVSNSSLYQVVRDTALTITAPCYRADRLKSEKKEEGRQQLEQVTLYISEPKQKKIAQQAADHGHAIANGISLAKELGDLPGNVCTPTHLANQATELAKGASKLKVEILEEQQMEALGMGSLLSVSKGSRQPAKLIVMEYKGGKKDQRPVVLVGKGLTFDAGGISLKPSPGMDEMKYDMCGAASVFGTLKACVELDLPINITCVVPSSENLPDGDANKPGDIVTSMAGLTIEILNTDAEGRLILCDALTYSKRFEPDVIVDIATLTGACVVALGSHATGLLSNDDSLANELLEAGNQANDKAWRLPLWDEYQPQLDSNFADIANIGGKEAGTITAACFLSRFTKEMNWAHLDIAGTAWKSGKDKGATGKPVSLLTQFLIQRCGLSS
jgi:leucyl aminopeptidase